jgi:hypothetical protein
VTDQQILTLCIAVVFPLSMLIYSNSRITEAKETLRAEMGTLRADIKLDFERLSNKIDHLAEEVATLKDLLSMHLREHHGVK